MSHTATPTKGPCVTRRSLLLAGAALAVTTGEAPVVHAAPAPPDTRPFLPAFQVGTPGEWDWRVYFAATEERAKELWAAETECPPEGVADAAVRPAPHLADFARDEGAHPVSDEDCFDMQWDCHCSRCSSDVGSGSYTIIAAACVCRDCRTPQEIDAEDHDEFVELLFNDALDVTDFALFSLLRAEDLLDESVREALAEEAELHPDCAWLQPFRSKSD